MPERTPNANVPHGLIPISIRRPSTETNDLPLEGRVVTADVPLTQRGVCEQVVAGGGDYFFPVKDHQPALEADIIRWTIS